MSASIKLLPKEEPNTGSSFAIPSGFFAPARFHRDIPQPRRGDIFREALCHPFGILFLVRNPLP